MIRAGLCAMLIMATLQPVYAQERWPDPIANEVIPYETAGLTHGPLMGRVTADSVRMWLRTREPAAGTVRFGKHLPLDVDSPDTRTIAFETTAAGDNIATIDLTDLMPATRYYYAVELNDALADLRIDFHDDWPSIRTLPDETTTIDDEHNPLRKFNVRFGVGHCASQAPVESGGQYGSPPVYDTMVREHADELDFALVNGDVIYEAERDGTIDGVRENYRLYFSRGRSFSRLFRNVPALFTFDDHDVGWDIHGCGQVGLRKDAAHLIRDFGLTAYENYLAWANYDGPQKGRIRLGTGTIDASTGILKDPSADFSNLDPATVSTIHLGAYTRGEKGTRRVGDDKAPKNVGVYALEEVVGPHELRLSPAPKVDEELTYSIGTHHYYDWQIGNCHFFALDTRGERSLPNRQDRADKNAFLLGETQRKWLFDTLEASPAEFIFLISPDPWMIYHTAAHVRDEPEAVKDDKGDGFPSFLHERNLLIDFLDKQNRPVLIFTGDVHASASVQISDNIWEMMCGPLGSTGHPLATLGNPPSGGEWESYDRKVDVRWVSPFPNNVKYFRQRNTFYGVVQVNNVMRVAAPSGQQPQFYAYDTPTVTVRWHDGYTGRLVYAETISAARNTAAQKEE